MTVRKEILAEPSKTACPLIPSLETTQDFPRAWSRRVKPHPKAREPYENDLSTIPG